MTNDWEEKQNKSVEEYTTTHFNEDEETGNIHTLFKHYISHSIREMDNPRLIDVGCGISEELPTYTRGLKCRYFGLDPIKANPQRKYTFINEKFEEHKGNYDAFVFASSLDHVENVANVAEKTKELANKGAIAIFMIGLNDRDNMAERFGVATYKKIFGNGHNFLIGWVTTALYRLPNMYLYLKRRDEKLKAGIPLDDRHFYYFTKENIEEYLMKFGEITDMTKVRGMNVLFATVKIEK